MAIKKPRNKVQSNRSPATDPALADVKTDDVVDDTTSDVDPTDTDVDQDVTADESTETSAEEPVDEATSDDELDPEQRFAKAYERRFPGAPKGAVFEAGENIIVKAHVQGDLLVVDEPVYRATKSPGSRRWRFHLLYSRGATMAKAKTKKVGKQTGDDKKTAWPYEVKDSGYFTA